MNNLWNNLVGFAKKNAPQILTALGIIGVGATVAVTAKSAIDIHENIKEAEKVKGDKLTFGEKVKVSYKEAIPVAVMAASTTACFCGATAELTRRNDLLKISKEAGTIAASAAITASNTALGDLVDKIKKNTDEETAKKILSGVVETDKNGTTVVIGDEHDDIAKNIIISGSNDNILCYDVTTGSTFEATYNDIKDAVREIEKYVNQGETMTINDFRGFISDKLKPVEVGYKLGWKTNDICYGWTFPIAFEGKLMDGKWYMAITYDVVPVGEWY